MRDIKLLRDKDIREPLFDFLEETYGKVRIIEEKTMGSSRADVVMVAENALYGIEIKSDADTYNRLASQIKDYDKYYDYNIVAVGTSHAKHICEHVPDHWGIITVEVVDSEFDFYIMRKPLLNPKVTWEKKLEILWRPELALIQEYNQMPKYKEKSKIFVKDKIVERLEKGKIAEEPLQKQVSQILMERDYNNVSSQLQEYHKGEIQRKLEKEKNPEEQIKLEMQRAQAETNFKKRRITKGRKHF